MGSGLARVPGRRTDSVPTGLKPASGGHYGKPSEGCPTCSQREKSNEHDSYVSISSGVSCKEGDGEHSGLSRLGDSCE